MLKDIMLNQIIFERWRMSNYERNKALKKAYETIAKAKGEV